MMSSLKCFAAFIGLVLLSACGGSGSSDEPRPPINDFTVGLAVNEMMPLLRSYEGKNMNQKLMLNNLMKTAQQLQLSVGESKVLLRELDNRWQLRCREGECQMSPRREN
jgi:hypothetical protein